MSDYASRIRVARANVDWTQKQLADALGVDEQTIKRREAGVKDPKKGERIAIAALTGVPPEFMEHGWEALMAPPSDDQIKRAAALLRPALGSAAQALAQARGEVPTQTDGPDHQEPGAEGGVA